MGRVRSEGDWKYQSRTVTDDQSVLGWVKWSDHPENRFAEDGTTAVTTSTMQVQANLVNFDINGSDETEIGTYAGNSGADDQVVFADAGTVQGLLDLINGIELGITRYHAGFGDFRPGFVIGAGDGLAVAATNIMLGRHADGLEIFADSSGLATANLFAAALGTPRARVGRGSQIPDHRQTGFTSTVAGVITKVREPIRSREEHPFTTTFETRLTGLHFGAAYATNAKTVSVFDQNNTLLFQETLAAANALGDADRYNFDNPIVTATGPIFVEASGTGALTDGPLRIQGYVRVA